MVLLAVTLWLTRNLIIHPGIPDGNDFLGMVGRVLQFTDSFNLFYIWSGSGFGFVQPPADVAPYRWPAQQGGDFRVATVPYFQKYMKVDGGSWANDLGTSSHMYSGHNFIGTGVWQTGLGFRFASYTHQLMLNGDTTKFAELLGRYNVKYLVVQGYDPTDRQSIPEGFQADFQRRFLEKQSGVQLVFDNGTAQVHDILDWRPRFTATPGYSLLVGGKSAVLGFDDQTAGSETRLPFILANDLHKTKSLDGVMKIAGEASRVTFNDSQVKDVILQFSPGVIHVTAMFAGA